MNNLVKIISDDSGELIPNPVWHLVGHYDDAHRTLCGGEAFGFAESSVVYEAKQTIRGGITCNDCIRHIKYYKSVKL